MSPSSHSSTTQPVPASRPQPSAPGKDASRTVGFWEGLNAAGALLMQSGLWLGETLMKLTVQRIEESTQRAGQVVIGLGNVPGLRQIAEFMKLDWLMGLSDRIDFEKVALDAQQLRQQYPSESPAQLAHRIMVQKAVQAGGIGLASSVLPGFAIALLAIDLAATTRLQTEMLYEIAAVYGMDLRDPARKGEVLGIFGLALGGRNAVRAGLGFLRNIPLAGAMIGAGTNATMLYSLGYAACRFYEAKQSAASGTPAPNTLETIQQESERYLSVAIAQQSLMDQILAHMILASYPEKDWEDILPELQTLQLDPNALERIATNLQTPQPIGALVQQLNRDFAIPLYAQCQRIAERDGTVSEQEAAVLEAIRSQVSVEP